MKKKTWILVSVAIIFSLGIGISLILIQSQDYQIADKDIQTLRVERGDVLSTIEAEGTVEAQDEVLINSPASSELHKILSEPGSHVKAGEVLVMLDTTPIVEEIENLENQLAMKKNALKKTKLNARSIKLDLEYNVENKKLKIASIKSEIADQKQLLEVGGISPAKFEKTKQELVSAQKNLQMVKEKNTIKLKQLETDKEGLELQIAMQEKRLKNKKNLLNEMFVRAPSDGIILDVYKKEGENVKKDQLLIMMSDLTSFKIKGFISEEKADMVKTGKTVFATVDQHQLPGKIGKVKPLVEDNKIQFEVYLEENSHPKLIPNLRIDLLVVKCRRDDVLRVKQNPVVNNKYKEQNVFLMNDKKAVKKKIKTGIKGVNYIEIKEGLKEGDEIVISDYVQERRKRNILIN